MPPPVSNTALETENLAFREVLDALPHLVWVADKEGQVTFLNSTWTVWTGRDIQSSLGEAWSTSLHPEDASQLVAGWEHAHTNGTSYEGETRFVHTDGTVIPCTYLGKPIKGDDGEVLQWVGTNLDLRQLKETSSWRRRNEELERINQELEQFAYVASHDLREPLNKVIAFGEQLKEKTGATLDEKSAQYLQIMLSAASRMGTLIDDLLAFARVGKETQPSQDVNLNVVVEEVWEALLTTVTETQAKLTVEKLPTVRGNPTWMRQVFQNLLSNSLKFRSPDKAPEIRIWAEPLNGKVLLHTQDNGIGFDPKYQEQIFDGFTRLHTRFEYPGTGIGLALCRRLLRRYGGSIKATGIKGEGATFTITLSRNDP